MKLYLLPMISPSKYVVRLGWSSVRPCQMLALVLCGGSFFAYPVCADIRT